MIIYWIIISLKVLKWFETIYTNMHICDNCNKVFRWDTKLVLLLKLEKFWIIRLNENMEKTFKKFPNVQCSLLSPATEVEKRKEQCWKCRSNCLNGLIQTIQSANCKVAQFICEPIRVLKLSIRLEYNLENSWASLLDTLVKL